MRVMVELFDPEPIENVLGPCIFGPEIVVYLCDARALPLVQESAMHRLYQQRGLSIMVRFYYFDATSPAEIRRVLAAVARDYPGCVFDFTGGRDLVLLEAGAFCEAHGLPGFCIDLASRRFINVRGCAGLASKFSMPLFTAEEIFMLTGATIHGYGHYLPQDMTPEFERQAAEVWRLVAQNPRRWAEFVNFLQAFCSRSAAQTLDVNGNITLNGPGSGQLRCSTAILDRLEQTGALDWYMVQGDRLRLHFASVLHKRCLLNQGIWLELHCYLEAKHSGLFDDVRTSVVVDWAGINGGQGNTKNEVDVLLVKGIVPVFISCKMSAPSPLALSEIMLLARKFGHQMGRAVVVCYAKLGKDRRAICQRATDLNIELIDREAIDNGQLAARLSAVAGR